MPTDAAGPAVAGAEAVDGRVLSRRGARTRARLLDVSADVFAAKGLHSTRVDDIVAAAASSHGTFYLYFSSKEDLFDQLVTQVSTEIQSLVDTLPTITGATRGRAALRTWLGDLADLYERRGPVIAAWTEAELSGERTGRHGDDALGSLVGGILEQVRVPKRSGLDPAVASLALVIMVERVNYYATTGRVKVTRDELIDTLMEIVDAALFA